MRRLLSLLALASLLLIPTATLADTGDTAVDLDRTPEAEEESEIDEPADDTADDLATRRDPTDLRPVIAAHTGDALMPAGTPIPLRLLENLNSQYTKDDEILAFEVTEDVVVNGITVVRKGAKGTGRVGDARAAKGWGKKGKVEFSIDTVEGADGYPIAVTCDTSKIAGNSTGAVAATIYFAPIFGGGVKGKKARIPKGSEFIATTVDSAFMHQANLERQASRVPQVRILQPYTGDDRAVDPDFHLLPAGTAVQLRSLETINSNATSDGEYLFFEVSQPVVIDGFTVIEAGSRALGLVGDSRAAKGWGRKGKIEMEIVSVRAADGTYLPLMTSEFGKTGEQKTGGTVLGVYSLGLAFGGAFKGGKVNIAKGTEFTVFLESTYEFEPNTEPIAWSQWIGHLPAIRAIEFED